MRILYAVQSSVAPPTFVFFTNVATEFHFSYQRYLENQLREAFGFEGTPIRLQVRSRRERSSSVRTAAGGGGTAKSRGATRGGTAKAGARRAGTARKRKRSG